MRSDADCECITLRSRVADLQAHVDMLSDELRLARERAEPESVRGPIFDSLHTPQSSSPPVARTSSDSSCHRILRPSFLIRGGKEREQAHIDRLGSSWYLWSDDTHLAHASRAQTTIPDDACVTEYGEELVGIFFDHCWAHLPVLHESSFREDHYAPLAQGRPAQDTSRFLIFMVFANAAHVRQAAKQGRSLSHVQFFTKAVQHLPDLMCAGDFEYIQGLLLLCMYGRCEPQSVDMWHTTGLALRAALGLNLHRQESLVHDHLITSEMTKRVFWSVYVMDRTMSIAMCRPLGIQDPEITIPFPFNLTDDDLTSSVQPSPSRPVSVKDMSTFIHVIKLRRLGAEIYKDFHSPSEHTSILQDFELSRQCYEEQVKQWLSTSPHYLIAPSMFQSSEWFQIAYHFAILSINRPSHAIPIPSSLALRVCADSAISLISCYGALFAKNKLEYSFIALNSIFMAAVTLLYTLRASHILRHELTKDVTETNINSCLTLIRIISGGRQIGDRCLQIVQRLGTATLTIFDRNHQTSEEVDREFMAWFGLKSQRRSTNPGHHTPLQPQDNYPSTDMTMTSLESVETVWAEYFAPGLNLDGTINLDLFPLEPLDIT